jgi:hypothetical protein
MTNRVIVVGTLDTIRDRGRDATTREMRNDLRGRIEQVTLQVTSPYIGAFQLPLEFEPGVKGRELLEGARGGETVLVAEGYVQLQKSFDARFAQSAEDRGREVREMRLHVRELRTPSDAEREAASAVWLEGVVAQPVRLVRHPELPNIQFAITILDVTLRRPSAFPGSRAVLTEQARVRIAIPTTHEHAELLFQPGNKVRVEGAVDCVLEAQGGAEVEAKRDELREGYARELDALPERWQQEQTAWRERAQGRDAARQEGKGNGRGNRGRPPAATLELAQRDLERRQRRELQRIGFAPRVQVMVGYVELLEGTPATLDESQELRRAFVKELRGRRTSNAAMRATASGRGRGPDSRREGDGLAIGAIESGAVAPGIDPAAGTVSVIRPRRSGRGAASTASVELPVMEPTLGHPALEANEQEQSVASIVAPGEQILPAIELIHAGETEQDQEEVRVE